MGEGLGNDHPAPEVIDAYAIGELIGVERASAETHFATCDACWRNVIASQPTQASEPRPSLRRPLAGALAAGDHVDHFEIVEQIGRGGLGEVYLARDTKLGRRVALKLVRKERLGSQAAVKRFLFEARATAQFNDPNIVTVHDVGEHNGSPYIALEYLRGVSLRQRIRAGPTMSEVEALATAAQIASALRAAHRAGVVHRDLKPDNVFLPTEGPLRVLDFGMGKVFAGEGSTPDAELMHVQDPTQVGLIVGTPTYMAPEQWIGSAVTPATDVFALGVLLFEMLSGKRFHDTRNVDELSRRALEPGPFSLARLSGLNDGAVDLVRLCLQKRPETRPSADEVFTELLLVLKEDFAFVITDPRLPFASNPAGSGSNPRSRPALANDSTLSAPRPRFADAPTLDQSTMEAAPSPVSDFAPTMPVTAVSLLSIPPTSVDALLPPTAILPRPVSQRRVVPFVLFALAATVGLVVAAVLLMRDDAPAPVLAGPGLPTIEPHVPTPAPAPAPVPVPVAVPVPVPVAVAVAAPVPVAVPVPAPLAAPELVPAPVAPIATEPTGPAEPPRRLQRVECRGPTGLSWESSRGKRVERAGGRCGVPQGATSLLARDATTGGVSRVPIVNGVADYGRLGRGRVWFQVKPWAKVELGRRALGTTPFAPISLVEGSYVALLSKDANSETRPFEIVANEDVYVRVDWR